MKNSSGFISHFSCLICWMVGHCHQRSSHFCSCSETQEKREMCQCVCASLPAHCYQEYFSPTWVYCAVNWMNLSCWKKTDFFLYLSSVCSFFTETWLCGLIPDCAAAGRLPSLHSELRHRTFRQNERWRYLLLHNNNGGWCNDVKVIMQHCFIFFHKLQTFLLSWVGVLHSGQCLHSIKGQCAEGTVQACPGLCGNEVIWVICAVPPQNYHRPTRRHPAVCPQSQQVCGWAPAPGLLRNLWQDPVCGF